MAQFWMPFNSQGYRYDGGDFQTFQWDHWVFQNGINGTLTVEIRDPFEKDDLPDVAFQGLTKEVNVQEYEVTDSRTLNAGNFKLS